MAAADVLPLGVTMQGTASIADTSDVDYFKLNLSTPSKINVNFTFPNGLGTGAAYSFKVLNQNGAIVYSHAVGCGEYAGAGLSQQAMYLPAGDFYIRIYGYHNDATWGKTYNLTVTNTPGNVETEFNDSTATADPLALGATIAGSAFIDDTSDVDYFKVALPTAGRLGVRFTYPSGLGTDAAYSLKVLNQNGDTVYGYSLAGGDYAGGWLSSQGMYLPAGDFYIRIYGYHHDATWGKTYNLTVTNTPGNVETEFNDSTATADPITLGATISGSSLQADTSDNDLFALDLAKPASVSLRLSFPSRLGTGTCYEVTVLNQLGNQEKSFDVTCAQWSGTWLSGQRVPLAAGRNYIAVYAYHNQPSWGQTYSLTAALALSKTPTPKISGKTKVGKTLTATTKAWAPAPVALRYQWFRSGKAIAGATGRRYKIVKADKKKKLTVRVTGSRAGYLPVSRTSAAKKIR